MYEVACRMNPGKADLLSIEHRRLALARVWRIGRTCRLWLASGQLGTAPGHGLSLARWPHVPVLACIRPAGHLHALARTRRAECQRFGAGELAVCRAG